MGQSAVSAMAVLSAAHRRVLSGNIWFAQLPPHFADQLLAHGQVRQLYDGQPLFLRGDPTDGIYAVLSGSLRVSGVSHDGKEALLTMLEPSMWFGEIALFDRLFRTHDVHAEGSDASVLFLRMADLDAMLEQEPRWWQQFGILMAFKTRLFMINMEDMALMPPDGRLARRLFWMMQTAAFPQSPGRIRLNTSQTSLAGMLAISRDGLNNSFAKRSAA